MNFKYVLLLLLISSKILFAPSAYEIAKKLPTNSIRLFDRSPIITANFSPDGKRLVTGSFAHGASVWNAKTGALITHLVGNDKLVYIAKFSPDGKKIIIEGIEADCITCEDCEFFEPEEFIEPKDCEMEDIYVNRQIWDATNYRKLYSVYPRYREKGENYLMNYVNNPHEFSSVNFSPDRSKKVVVAGGDVTISDVNRSLIKKYFKNKNLPLEQQALFVTLDALSQQKNGEIITKKDLVQGNLSAELFKGVPENIRAALKEVYNVSGNVFTQPNKAPTDQYGNIKQKDLYKKVSPMQLANMAYKEKSTCLSAPDQKDQDVDQ